MDRFRTLGAAVLMVLAVLTICCSAYLFVEMRQIAGSAQAPERTSALFSGFERVIGMFVPGDGTARPADFAGAYSRGLYAMVGLGVFLAIGAAFISRSGRRSED